MKTTTLKTLRPSAAQTLRVLCAISLLCAIAPRHGFAQSASWLSTAGNGNWSTTGNWSGGVPAGTTTGTPGAIYGNGPGATATFNAASSFTTITVDANRQVTNIVFDTNAASYTIGSAGANGGNAIQLFNGTAISIASTILGSNLTETINAPILLDPYAAAGNTGNFSFANNSSNATDVLVIAGSIGVGSTDATTDTLPLTLTGVLGGTNIISGSIGNGVGAGQLSVKTSGSAIWELSNPNSTFSGGMYAGGQTNPASFSSIATLAIGASSTGPAGAPTSGPIGTGTLFLNGGNIEAVNGAQTIGNNMISNYDSGGGPEYCITFGGSTNLTLTGTLFNANHYFTITVNNTALTTFAGEFDNTNQFFGFDGSGNVELTGTLIQNGPALTYAGKGSLAISGVQTYTQGTNIDSGTVIFDGTTVANSSISSGVVNVSTGAGYTSTVFGPSTYYSSANATLLVKGNFLVGSAGAASINVYGGNGTSTGQGTLSLVDGSINTLTIQSTAGGATVLTLGANSILNMEVGSSSDSIALGSGLKAGVTSTVLVNITGLGGLNGTTQNLITTANTSNFTTGASNNFLLNTTSGNFGGYTVSLTGATTTGDLSLTETGLVATPATAFWSGTVSGTWNSFVNGNANNTNWLTAASAGADTNQVPSSTTNVLFNEASGATNLNTVLGANTAINSLEFTSAASGAGVATIGSGTFGAANGTLTINASGTNYEGVSGVGITVDNGAGTNVINAPVTLGGNQTWLVNNSQSNPLTVNGSIGGAHALTIGGSGEVLLTGSNGYTGNTTVQNGFLNVSGTLYPVTSPATVSVSGSGAASVAVLGGSGLINAAVSVGGGLGTQMITGGSLTTSGTITLANGLTITSGGIAYFDNLTTAANFINITNGNLTDNTGAVIEVPSLGVGTYQLIGDSAGTISGTSNITIDTLLGAAAPSNYSLQITSGTLQLVVSSVSTAQPTLTLGNIRVIGGQSGTLTGVAGNNAGGGALSGTLSDNSSAQTAGSGTLNVSSFPTNPVVVAAGTSGPYTAVISNVGTSYGANQVNVLLTDGTASPTTAAASGTVSVLQNRVVTASTAAIGSVHIDATGAGSTTLSSPGADNANTRVTVNNGGTDSGTNGLTVTGGNTATIFNGTVTDTRSVTGTFGTLGLQSGSVTITTNGEGLTGEAPINVNVGYTAQVFSGQASWASSTGGSWATNSLWGDTNVSDLNGAGAPGLAGAASIGDTATFNDVAGQSGVSTVSLNGANPTLASITFNSTNGYAIVPGSGGSITLQGAATPIVVSVGTDSITAALAGTGAGLNKSGAGTLILGGADSYTGSTTIGNGVIQTNATGVLPITTFLTLGDVSNDSGQLALGGNQTITGVASVGTGASNGIVGGTTSTSTLTIATGNVASVVNTLAGNLGGSGANQNNLNVTLTGVGTQVVSGSITYTGATNLQGGVFQTSNLLPDTSSISLSSTNTNAAGGVWQPMLTGSTNYNFTIGTNSAGNVSNWSGGGFAAYGGILNLTANGGALLTWGNGGAVNIGGVGGQSITFGSSTSNNQVILTNNIFLDTGDTYNQNIDVIAGAAGSSALLSGILSPGTGLSGIVKTGGGVLYLSGASTYTGATNINNGILIAQNNSYDDGATAGAFGISTTSIQIGDGGIGGNTQSTPAGANLGLMIANGNYTMARPVAINTTANGANSISIGGTTNYNTTFSGLITADQSFQVVQVATTGGNALNITGGITDGNGSTITTAFNNVGAVNVTGVLGGAGTISVSQIGAGTTTFSNANTYTGSTVINNGRLVVTNANGSATGTGPVYVTPNANAAATLSGTGIISGAVTTSSALGLNVPHIAPGVNTSGNFGGVGTLTLNGGLTIGYESELDFDLGTSSDLIAVNGQLTLNSNVVLDLNPVAGFVQSGSVTYDLITYTGALTGSTNGWTVSDEPVASTSTFSVVSGTVMVTIASTASPGVAYWSGAQGSGGNGTWSTITSNNSTNWLTAISGGIDTNQVPSGTSNVFFIADTGSNTNTYLGANFAINSLNFTGTDATVTTGSSVTITGSIAGSGTNNSLTINATNANGNTAGNGITMGPGSGAATINAPLVLGGNQTWTLNASPSSPLTVNGAISGAHALAVSGSGELILGGNNTFTNGLTINNSVDVVLNNAGALNSTSPDSVTFGPSSTGTINLNGNSVAFGTLASSGGSPVIQNNNATPVTLTVDPTASGTYAGTIQNGGSGSLSLAIGGPGSLTLNGVNTYTGSTTVNGGDLLVNTSIGAGNVTVNSSGTLGGSGTIGGAVTISGSGKIAPTVGTSNSPATLTLSNGLTIQSGGIAAFNVIYGGGNDEIAITGNLTLNSGAILQVSPYLTLPGTYALITYTGVNSNPTLSGVVEENLSGGALASNYSFNVVSGTVELVVASSPQSIATISINTPSTGARGMQNTTIALTGSVGNAGTGNTLSGTLANAPGYNLSVSNFIPQYPVVGAGASVTYTGSIAGSATLGNQTFGVSVTDGNSINTSATATGTVDIVQNRTVTASNVPTFGVLHEGSVVTGTFTLSSPGADNQNTRVTVADSGSDAFGLSVTGGNPTTGTFNGSYSDQRVVSGTLTAVGLDSGTTLVTTGEGLTGESPINVTVGYTAQVFSGHATWGGAAGNSSWSTNSNWGDTAAGDIGGIGAPGLAGALSIGDTVTFTDNSTETVGGTTAINLNGVNPSLASLTFSSVNTVFNIAQGTGSGTLSIQAGGGINVTAGKGIISSNLSANNLTVTAAAGADLLLSGTTLGLTGTTNIVSGTLTLGFPGLLGGTANIGYDIASGATLELNASTPQNIAQTAGSLTFIGSGTLLKSGTGTLENHSNGGNIYMDMTGGVIEIAGGAFLSGGNTTSGTGVGNPANGNGSIIWTNNLASLQLDAGATIDPWDGNNITVNALLGSGTVTRTGYNNGSNTINIGINNGSGTFAGTINNQLGNINVNKVGTGTEVFTGSSSFGGYVALSGSGTLRITNATGIGNFGQSFVTEQGQHTATAQTGATLDLYGGITVNEMLTLNGGNLINSAVGTTSVLDSGIAGIDFNTDNAVTSSSGTAITVAFAGGSGTGAAANAGTVPGTTAPLGGNNPMNIYTQMTNGGSGYLPGSAPTVTITQSTTALGGTVTAVVSQLILDGNNNFIGGNGNLQINGQISGAGGFTTIGTGTLILTNNELYTGSTVLGAGSSLELGTGYSSVGSITGAGSVVVAGSGTQTFAGIETYTGSTTINPGSTLQLGNGTTDGAIVSSTVSNSGALVFNTMGNQNLPAVISGGGSVTMNGSGNQEISGNNNYTGATVVNSGTLQLGSTTALGNSPQITVNNGGSLNVSNGVTPQTVTLSGAGQVLTLNNGASLNFGVTNTGNDELVINGAASTSVNGTITINLSLISGTGQGSTPFTIISDASGGLGGATFVLGNLPALSTGEIVSQTANAVTVLFTGVSTVYWEGQTSPFWSDYSNFTSDPGGLDQISGTFGPSQDIVFSASGATGQTSGGNFLNQDVSGHSLTIEDPAGVDIGQAGSNVLTLAGNTGNTGVTVTSAAGSALAEIDAYLDFAGTPNITVNNSGGLLITGIISGSNGLIMNGSGMLTLVGPGDAAADNSYSGTTQLLSGTLSVNADGAFGASNMVTFNPGAGNSVTLQQAYESPYLANNTTITATRTFAFLSGTGILDPGPSGSIFTIAGPVIGTGGALQVVDTGEVVLSGSVAFNGNAYVSSGTLNLTYPGTLAQTGSSNFNVASGATMVLTSIAAQNISPAAGDGVAFTGSGTLMLAGPGQIQLHGNIGAQGTVYPAVGNTYIDMGAGSTIEISGSADVQNGGLGSTVAVEGYGTNGSGAPFWTGTYNGTPFTNLATLQIDSGAILDTWNGNNIFADALTGSGTLTRLGFANIEAGSVVTIGDNNGSGTFSGVITNVYGNLNMVKEGSGTETFSGNNSYSGTTLVSGGVLRAASNTALGFGGPVYYTAQNAAAVANGSVTVSAASGTATLDLYDGVTVDKQITLNNGRLINGVALSTSVLDNGVAAVAISGSQVGTYTTPQISDTAAPGTGTGATFTAGTGTAPSQNVAGVGNGIQVYGEVTAAGTGYTVAPTLVFSDSGTTGSGVTATALLSSLTLSGTNDIIGGNGNLTINAQISGTGGFTTTGTGTLTLNGSNSYTGTTTLASGDVLVNNGTITGVVNVSPNANAAATLSGTGVFNGLVTSSAASGLNVAHIAPGVNTSGNFGAAGTLTLNGGLTIGNGTNLDFDLGTNSDLIAVTGALSLGNGVTLNVNQVSGFAPGTYTLITYTGALTGNTTGWVATGVPGENATFASGGGVVTVTLIAGANNSQLTITPSSISLGSVLVGFTPSSTTGTLANASNNGSNANYTTVATGSASVSPANGTLGANSSAALTVGASSPINLTSGNNQVIGTVYATNSSNSSGSAAPVNVTANVFQAFTGTTPTSTSGANSAALTLTNLASTDGGQRAGVSLTGFSVSNPNFAITGTGSVGIANATNVTSTVGTITTAASDLNGSYSYTGSVTGTAQYTDPALALQAGVSNQTWSNVTLNATVTGQTSNARTNVFSAQIQSGSSYAGYSLSSSVMVGGIQQHPNTGSGGTTTATLLAGTASATTTVDMSFDSSPVSGPDDGVFRTSDILTLTGIHSTGTTTIDSLTVTLTDEYVLQLSYDTGAAGLELIGQNTGTMWVNAADLNSSIATEQLYANETYATYVAGTTDGDTPALGAYGYDAGVAWAVLDHTSVSDPISEFAVIPEPDTYAMIFSGFGMLIGFRRLRRRRSKEA